MLKQWAKTFRSAHKGSDPLIWLDKACIDQDNLNEALAVLPIFMAGCRSLLIIAGTTYTTRLWCLLEIFTFLRMGGTFDRITIVPLIEVDNVSEEDIKGAMEQLYQQFSEVDTAKAECYHSEEKQRLLSVIETGFGSCSEFNYTLRSLLFM